MSFAQELKDFTAGFQSGYKMTKKSWQEKKYEAETKAIEDARKKGEDGTLDAEAATQVRAQGISQVAAASGDTAGTGSSTSSPTSSSTSSSSGKTPHNGGVNSDPVATDLAPHQRAFLNAIAGPESAGKYNVRFHPEKSNVTFDSYDKHPGIYEKGPAGPSSAAGRYQFVKKTWDDLGGGNFSPENQDRRAWQLAQRDYRIRTKGRDLNADLQTGGFTPQIASALGKTWVGLRDNPNKAISWYNASMKRYSSQPNDAPTQTASPVTPVERRALPAPAPTQTARGGLQLPFSAPAAPGAMPRAPMGTGVTPTPRQPTQTAAAEEDYVYDEDGNLVPRSQLQQHATNGGMIEPVQHAFFGGLISPAMIERLKEAQAAAANPEDFKNKFVQIVSPAVASTAAVARAQGGLAMPSFQDMGNPERLPQTQAAQAAEVIAAPKVAIKNSGPQMPNGFGGGLAMPLMGGAAAAGDWGINSSRSAFMADGGLVPEEEESEDAYADRTQDAQMDAEYASLGPSATETPTNSMGVAADAQAQPATNNGDDYNPRELVDTNIAAEATHAGLTWIQNTFNLNPKGLPTARNEEGQRAFASNAGAMSQADKEAIDRTVDPRRQLTPAERALAGMNGVYMYHLQKGDTAAANRMAGAMLMYSRNVTQRMGSVAQAALERGDVQGATMAMKTAMDAVPNGQDVEFGKVTPRGVQYKLTNPDGTLSESGVATNDQLLQRAIGMSNGTAWLEAVVAGTKPLTAKQRQDMADRKTMEDFENEQFSQGDVSEYEAGLSPRARELWAKLPTAAKNAKIRQFMAEKRAQQQGERQTQQAEEKERREAERAKKAEDKEKAAQDKAAQKELEIKTDQEAAVHADNIRSAQEALAAAQDGTDPDALDQARQALTEARRGAQEFLETQRGSKDGLRKYSAMFGMAGRGGLRVPSAGGASGGGSGGGGKTAEERERAAATREYNEEVRGLNIQRKRKLNELGHEVMGDQQGPVYQPYTEEQAPDKVRGINEATIGAANVAKAEENYQKVMADKETKGLSLKDRLDNPEALGGIDTAITNLWNRQTKDGKKNTPLDPDKDATIVSGLRSVATQIMRANPNMTVNDAAAIAFAAGSEDTPLEFDKKGRLTIPGAEPVVIGRDGIASIQRVRRSMNASGSTLSDGKGNSKPNPFAGDTAGYQSPSAKRQAAKKEEAAREDQRARERDREAGLRAMDAEYKDLKAKLQSVGDWDDSMDLPQARRAWADRVQEGRAEGGTNWRKLGGDRARAQRFQEQKRGL